MRYWRVWWRKIDFSNTIIIMTSNVGARKLKGFGNGVGFGTSAQKMQESSNARSVIENALKNVYKQYTGPKDDMFISIQRLFTMKFDG